MKKIIQLLKAQIARKLCGFHFSRSLTKWLVILGNLTVLSALLDAQTPTPTPPAIFVGAEGPNLGSIEKFDAVTGTVINSDLINLPLSEPGLNALALSGNALFVANPSSVSKYDATTGALISSDFITGLDNVCGLAVFGENIFVANEHSGTVGEYNASTGAIINASLIKVSGQVFGLTVSGNSLFVTNGNGNGNRVSKYNAVDGALINPDFITGLYEAEALATSGNNLFLAHTTPGDPDQRTTISQYDATTGASINSDFIALDYRSLGTSQVVLGNRLFLSPGGSAIAEYNATTGALINANFITGFVLSQAIAVGPTPTPAPPAPQNLRIVPSN
jgi:PQQ-like domain